MKFASIEEQIQDSKEWHDFRRTRIGASDVPAIMGTDDWRTPFNVFTDKTQGSTFKGNWATQRGKALEPVIISKFCEKMNLEVSHPVLIYEPWPVLSASLDGFVLLENAVVEAKAPAIHKHCLALNGIIPSTYEDQLQAQLLVSGASKAYYVSYHDGEPEGFDLAIVEVYPDLKRQEEILTTCKLFWEKVISKVWS